MPTEDQPIQFISDEEEAMLREREERETGNASRDVGRSGEDLACRFLWKRNFRILERNYFGDRGEIDIIAEKGGRIHFVEVKSSAARSRGEPEERVDAEKRELLRETARMYLDDFRDPPPAGTQFDVVSLVIDDSGRPVREKHIQRAF